MTKARLLKHDLHFHGKTRFLTRFGGSARTLGDCPGAKCTTVAAILSGLQKGPAERGHVKKRQKSSKSVKKFFDTFRQFSRRAKNVKNRQKVSKSFSTLFDNFRAAPFFRPLLGGSEIRLRMQMRMRILTRPETLSSQLFEELQSYFNPGDPHPQTSHSLT